MKLLTFLALFISISAAADESCLELNQHEFHDIKSLKDAISWTAASDEDIKKAFCTRKTPFTLTEINDWLKKNSSSETLSKNINGIDFEDESPENLEGFKHLTTFVDIMGEKIPAKQKTLSSKCKKVDCAVKEIFGAEVGPQLLFMQRRYGMNGSHLIENETFATPWKKEELDTVLMALSDFPEGVMPIQPSRTFIHAPRKIDNGSTIANAVITIYERWNKQSKEQQRSTVVHELGHAIAGVTDLDESEHWMKHAGWSKTTKIVNGESYQVPTAKKPETIISEYGKTNEWEDLAESVVAYRYNPKALLKASPEKYVLIKETIFDDVEYTSAEACKAPKRLSEGLKAKAQEKARNWKPSAGEIKDIGNRCSGLAVNNLAEKGSIPFDSAEFKICYDNAVRTQTTEFLKQELKSNPNADFLGPMIRNSAVDVPEELLKNIAEQAKVAHKSSLKKQMLAATKKDLFCDSQFLQYAYQEFDKKEIGLDTYSYRTQLQNVGGKLCSAKAAKNLDSALNEMFR